MELSGSFVHNINIFFVEVAKKNVQTSFRKKLYDDDNEAMNFDFILFNFKFYLWYFFLLHGIFEDP